MYESNTTLSTISPAHFACLTGLFLIAAILTAFWTYDTYDGRWGKVLLPNFKNIERIHGTFGLWGKVLLPNFKNIERIHGTFGLWTLLVFPVFVIYAFHRGQRRLIQPGSLTQLAQVGKPIWWYTLNRLTNTLALLALTFALFSGKMMDETWLPKGELQHGWYYAHLASWVMMVSAIALHLLMNAKVGGSPLLLSMLNWQIRDQDSPIFWSAHASRWWSEFRRESWSGWFQTVSGLILLEAMILFSIFAAWLIPLFK